MIDYSIGVCFLGNSCIGKSSFSIRLEKDQFFYDMLTTIGVEYLTRIYNINYKDVNYNLKWRMWDTAGQESFRSLVKGYFKVGTIYILMYDITNRKSFIDLNYWINEIKNIGSNEKFIYIVGNKTDVEIKRVVTKEEGLCYANYLGLKFFEVSVKKNIGLKDVVNTINNDIIKYILDDEIERETKEKINIKYEFEKYIDNYKYKDYTKEKNCCTIM